MASAHAGSKKDSQEHGFLARPEGAAEQHPPVAVDDAASTTVNAAVTIEVLANDSDPDGDELVVDSILADPQHGSAQINADDTVTYTPDTDYFGSDSFTYVVSDGRGGTDTADVTITINEGSDGETHSTGPISMEIIDAHPKQGARLTESQLGVDAGQTQISAIATLSVQVDITHGDPSQLRAYLLPPSWNEADRLTVFENPTSLQQSYLIDGLSVSR